MVGSFIFSQWNEWNSTEHTVQLFVSKKWPNLAWIIVCTWKAKGFNPFWLIFGIEIEAVCLSVYHICTYIQIYILSVSALIPFQLPQSDLEGLDPNCRRFRLENGESLAEIDEVNCEMPSWWAWQHGSMCRGCVCVQCMNCMNMDLDKYNIIMFKRHAICGKCLNETKRQWLVSIQLRQCEKGKQTNTFNRNVLCKFQLFDVLTSLSRPWIMFSWM